MTGKPYLRPPMLAALAVCLWVGCGEAPRSSGFEPSDPDAVDVDESDGQAVADLASDVDAIPDGVTDAPVADEADAADDATPDASGTDAAEDPSVDDADTSAPDTGSTAVAECPVESMVVLYSGFLPPNPFEPFPSADDCVSAEHDVIIVLGCPNEDNGDPAPCQIDRVDIALALSQAGYGRRFITTGGAVQNAFVEAETLRDLLVERGVAASDIIVEPLAEHTDENLYYSTRIMEQQVWMTALVVSDDPGHLMMTALCDSNCCVELGRLTLFELEVAGGTRQAGHYVRYPWAEPVSAGECQQIEFPSKVMCLNLGSRRACADDFQL